MDEAVITPVLTSQHPNVAGPCAVPNLVRLLRSYGLVCAPDVGIKRQGNGWYWARVVVCCKTGEPRGSRWIKYHGERTDGGPTWTVRKEKP